MTPELILPPVLVDHMAAASQPEWGKQPLGVDHRRPMVTYLREPLVAIGTVDANDVDRWGRTDSPREAAALSRAS